MKFALAVKFRIHFKYMLLLPDDFFKSGLLFLEIRLCRKQVSRTASGIFRGLLRFALQSEVIDIQAAFFKYLQHSEYEVYEAACCISLLF